MAAVARGPAAGHNHGHHGPGSAPALTIATGMVPCPLTTFIMTYAVANDMVGEGLALAAVFACGMVLTVAVFPIAAVLLREEALPLMVNAGPWRARIAHGLEIVAVLAVILMGGLPLIHKS
jgi:nickel/cobalt transporter (NicO) family protein